MKVSTLFNASMKAREEMANILLNGDSDPTKVLRRFRQCKHFESAIENGLPALEDCYAHSMATLAILAAVADAQADIIFEQQREVQTLKNQVKDLSKALRMAQRMTSKNGAPKGA